MKATLVIPDIPGCRTGRGSIVFRLTWRRDQAEGHYGLGLMLGLGGEIFVGSHFRALRDAFGAGIETDEPGMVCGALGFPIGEPGIVQSDSH